MTIYVLPKLVGFVPYHRSDSGYLNHLESYTLEPFLLMFGRLLFNDNYVLNTNPPNGSCN